MGTSKTKKLPGERLFYHEKPKEWWNGVMNNKEEEKTQCRQVIRAKTTTKKRAESQP